MEDELAQRIADLANITIGTARYLVGSLGVDRAERLPRLLELGHELAAAIVASQEGFGFGDLRDEVEYWRGRIAELEGAARAHEDTELAIPLSEALHVGRHPSLEIRLVEAWQAVRDGRVVMSSEEWARNAEEHAREVLGETSHRSSPRPCDTCVNYVGRRVAGGSLQGELCCAMHPSGPEVDECPDWEDKNSPDARRRKLREKHRQQVAELEARHRKELERLEADIKHEIREVPLPAPQSTGEHPWGAPNANPVEDLHRAMQYYRRDLGSWVTAPADEPNSSPLELWHDTRNQTHRQRRGASLLDLLEPTQREEIWAHRTQPFFELEASDVIGFSVDENRIEFSDRWNQALNQRTESFSIIFPLGREYALFCPDVRWVVSHAGYYSVVPADWRSFCQMFRFPRSLGGPLPQDRRYLI